MRWRLPIYLLLMLTSAAAFLGAIAPAGAADKKPNILVIWGDDIGTWNISHNNRGMMGYKTPNIDRVASKFLMSLKDYPPSQKPGDWSLDSLEKQIKEMTAPGR